MATLNEVHLIGFVGDDPKIINTRNGKPMSSLTLATTDREIKRPDGTTIPERTEWHNITVFGHTADFVQRYVRKGAQLFVHGSIHTRSFDKNDGTKGYITEITADNIQLLDRRPQQTASSPDMAAAYANPGGGVGNDDDVPF
nr:MAG TPA: Single strand binding protein [Caudoviricetes sp.]